MALSGIHVVCAYSDGRNFGYSNQPLLTDFAWSETLSANGTTTHAAPGDKRFKENPIFRIRASADSWVSVGSSPTANSSSTMRLYVPASTDYDIMVKQGDKLAWETA